MIKEKCPICGGTILLPEDGNVGECDSCANHFTLSELQNIQNRQNAASESFFDSEADDTATAFTDPDEASVAELCKMAKLALESEQWDLAFRFANEIIERDPKYAEAYLYRLLASMRLYKKEELANCQTPFESDANYRLLMRFADTYLKMEIENYSEEVNARYTNSVREGTYFSLCEQMKKATAPAEFATLAKKFHNLGDHRDSAEKSEECQRRSEEISKKQKKTKLAVLISCVSAVTLSVAIIISVIAIAIGSNVAKYSASNFEITVTGKQNLEYNSSYVWYNIDFDIKNDGKLEANYLEGYLTMKDKSGTTLTSGSVNFRGSFMPKQVSKWDVEWKKTRDADAERIWELDYDEITFYFRITEIRYENRKVKEYKVGDKRASVIALLPIDITKRK